MSTAGAGTRSEHPTLHERTVVTEMRAAGTLPWRRRRGRLEVALVHRPRYDDWAWAKGKLEQDEEWATAAVRETAEETGLLVACGLPLPSSYYRVTRGGELCDKEVRYWAAEVVGGDGVLTHEIDEVAWLGVAPAAARLDYPQDREQLDALAQADAAGILTTWPLVLVRHAKALPRTGWPQDDWLRPLDPAGFRRAEELSPLLAAYGLRRLVTSTSLRCTQTLAPLAERLGAELKERRGLSEEGYDADPQKATKHLDRALERGRPAAMCSHGPVLPALTAHLQSLVDPHAPSGVDALAALREATDGGMVKGEALVCHVVGSGAEARVVAVERYGP